jgi:UDP-glucose 4-epimerase
MAGERPATAPPGDWSGRRVVVTGGAGFLGSNLLHALVERGAIATALDAALPGSGANPANLAGLEDRIDRIDADLRTVPDTALAALLRDADAVFHLAAQTGHMASMETPLEDLAINATGTLRLLEALRHANPRARFIHASTRQIYGPPLRLPVDESHPLAPPDCNGVAKLAAEGYAMVYARVHGIPATALRLTNCYGPRMRVRDARQTFLGIWIRAALRDEDFEVWGGEQLRDFTHAEDVVAAMLGVAAAPAEQVAGRVFNVGGFPPVSLRDLAAQLVAVAGAGSYRIVEFPAARKAIDIGSYVADDAALRAATGWTPRVDLATGLTTTLAYFRPRLDAYA